ncbi:class I SAM-dependent RNA methyltransferase [Arthrobacter castelli]|uniref:class I SAM-dependent RNA methyltransferase n=1 Tax=Arthrobacter castelli TaxID=271431 RepID=UPI0004169371|nr:TRAM domain-containing protein [Arthrobacter castelli]
MSDGERAAAELLTVTLGPVAHGGHFVARHEGRVIFVRHGLPSETVRIRLTDAADEARFWRADVVDVVDASPARVAHPWKPADALAAASAGRQPVGGAEFGHIEIAAQRRLKADVLTEQLRRLGGVERHTEVEAPDPDSGGGMHWRTRVAFAVEPDTGRLGMRPHRSNDIVPIRSMPLALAAIEELTLWAVDFSGIERVEVAAPGNGSRPLILLIPRPGTGRKKIDDVVSRLPEAASVALWEPDGGAGDGSGKLTRLRGRSWVAESAGGHHYRVTGDGFWQVHRRAPDVLMGAVLAGLDPQPGAQIADLYAGAGLFTAPLATAVGDSGSVLSVEAAAGTSRDARRNLHGFGHVDIVQGRVERVLQSRGAGWDAVVLDPPRTGAGKQVVRSLVRARPEAIGYVSCDPASFARDLGYFRRAGWNLAQLRAFDLYPNTHHLETFAVLTPDRR